MSSERSERPELEALTQERFDLVIVGGGIYGAMLSLEAVRRGLRPLLLDRGDFGAATSYNSLRIVHGGLRYLQSLDLARFRESIQERRWFLRTFPDLVEPLPCLMPLYGEGLRRPSALRLAVWLNDLLSARRNVGVGPEARLPAGRVVAAEAVRELFPAVDTRGLRGGAIWYDAFIPSAPQLLLETLRWSRARGAVALSYVAARSVELRDGRVAGVRAEDVATGRDLLFRSEVVVNAAGPWAPRFAAACGSERPDLFEPSIAWNVAFHREPLSACALAVQPRGPGAHTYFLVSWKGTLLAGTGHAPFRGDPDDPTPSPQVLRKFIDDLNEAVPPLGLKETDVGRVFSGLLPARRPGTAELTTRAIIVDHGAEGGPRGLWSLSGVKLTTSRRVADQVLRRAFPAARRAPDAEFTRPTSSAEPAPDYPFEWMPGPEEEAWRAHLEQVIRSEAVMHLDDLLLRRSSLGDNPERARALAPRAAQLLDWDASRVEEEVARVGREAQRQRAIWGER